jgi:hypothetical protein
MLTALRCLTSANWAQTVRVLNEQFPDTFGLTNANWAQTVRVLNEEFPDEFEPTLAINRPSGGFGGYLSTTYPIRLEDDVAGSISQLNKRQVKRNGPDFNQKHTATLEATCRVSWQISTLRGSPDHFVLAQRDAGNMA